MSSSKLTQKLTNVPKDFMKHLYEKLKLDSVQRKEFHFLVATLKTLSQIKILADVTYEDIKEKLCCIDRECICGSQVEGQLHLSHSVTYQPTISKDAILRLKKQYQHLKGYEKKIETLKRIVAERKDTAQVGDSQPFNEIDVLKEIAYLDKEVHKLYHQRSMISS